METEPINLEYVWVTFLYMGKQVKEAAKYLKDKKLFIHDFYSGYGYVELKDVISWEHREVKGVFSHPWTTIYDGVDKCD